MIETKYNVQFRFNNGHCWHSWARFYDTQKPAQEELVYHLNTGAWKPSELRVVKITTTTITEILP